MNDRLNEHTDPQSTRQTEESLLRRITMLYVDGFRSMTVGRKLWLLIIIKLFILFFIFKLFFFPDILSRDYDTDAERAEAVRETLLSR